MLQKLSVTWKNSFTVEQKILIRWLSVTWFTTSSRQSTRSVMEMPNRQIVDRNDDSGIMRPLQALAVYERVL